MGFHKTSPFWLFSVLLVAPSASLAGPVPNPAPTVSTDTATAANSAQVPATGAVSGHPVVIPWGPGLAGGPAQATPLGGFIYCAGCSPINPGQLVFPANIPLNRALSASGVIPPPIAKAGRDGLEQQLNGLGNAEEPGKEQKLWDDGGIPVQQMALHDDGRYSFSYNTAHAQRQEERQLDGTVSGSYSYTDPEGKLVQIDYTAGPRGYQAYGDNVPPQPALPLPLPVQDTLEVQLARQQFLDTYNKELERIHRDREEAEARAVTASSVAPSSEENTSSTTPSSSEVSEDSAVAASELVSNDEDGSETDQNEDDALIVSGKTESENKSGEIAQPLPVPTSENQQASGEYAGSVIQDEEADSIVISAKGQDENQQGANQPQPIDVRSNLPDPSYQITIPIGVGGNAQLSVHQNPGLVGRGQEEQEQQVSAGNNMIGQGEQSQAQAVPAKSNLQPYFYYVSVGGQPHYVTSNTQPGYNSPYPTSLQASLLGAMPLAAVHDTQVPNHGGSSSTNDQGQQAIRPVFLDLENGLKEQSMMMKPVSQSQQVSSQVPTIFNAASLMQNNQNVQNPFFGHLIPLGLSQGNGGHTFGYIPAIFLNNNNGNNGGVVASQGSQQMNNVQLQQKQASSSPSVPTLNNQPIIVLASKK